MPKRLQPALRYEDLAKAARRVIVRDGLGKATVGRVALEAGCSPGLITYHAKTIDELLIAAARYTAVTAIAKVDRLLEKYTGIEAIRRVAMESIPLDKTRADYRLLWISFWDLARSSKSVAKVLNEYLDRQVRMYKALFLTAKKLGEIPADVDVTEEVKSFIVLLDGIGIHGTLGRPRLPARLQMAMVDEWIKNHLRPL